MTQTNSEKLDRLMTRFIKRNYPVSKVKYMNHFKRAIILDGGQIFILNRKTSHELRNKLITILKKVFDVNDGTGKSIIDKFIQF